MNLSPAGWLAMLEKRLDDRWTVNQGARLAMGAYDAYYEGDHNLLYATRKYREAFGSLFSAIADNWCPLVVDSSVERLNVQGFRFGGNEADSLAWDIWQANGLDALSQMVHTEAVKLAEAYWLVEPKPRGSSDPPLITCEHPSQVIVATNPANHRDRRAALKKWQEDDGYGYANLYLPAVTIKYKSQRKLQAGAGQIAWQSIGQFTNRLGSVPVVPIRNAPGMLRGGVSDLQVAYPIQDAMNKLLADMLIGAEYQAFPQRVLLGVEVLRDPVTGMPLRSQELQASQSRLMAFPDPSAKIAQWDAADLVAYVSARVHLRDELTAHTKLPAHYVSGETARASGDALKAGETGLVAKTNAKKAPFGEGHEDMMRLSFLAMGDTERASVTKAETIWKDSESRTFGELIDGLVKLSTIGVPPEALWERAGFSPTEIARFKDMEPLPAPPAMPGGHPGQMADAAPARATFSPIN